MDGAEMLLFDAAEDREHTVRGVRWQAVTDRVMGGRSAGALAPAQVDGRPALALTGAVSLEDGGGFVQMRVDLSPASAPFDASGHKGLRLTVHGDGADYDVRLKTPAARRPWQSYRATFTAPERWSELELPFAAFVPYRLDAPLDLHQVLSLGILAVGRAGRFRLALARLTLYP